MVGQSNSFSPIPYQSTTPYAVEGQLAAQLGNPAHPLALNTMLGYQAERQGNQFEYSNYMKGVHQLQAAGQEATRQAGLRSDAIDVLKLAGTPGVDEAVAGSAILNPLRGGGDMSVANQFGKMLATAKAYSDEGAGFSGRAAAGMVPYAGQTVAQPGGVFSGTTGESAITSGSKARSVGDVKTQSVNVPGSPLPVRTTTTTTAGGAGGGGNIGNVGGGGGGAETPLPGAAQPTVESPQQQGSQTANTPQDTAKQQAISQGIMRRIATTNPERAKEIQANGSKFTISPDGTRIIYTGKNGTLYAYDATK